MLIKQTISTYDELEKVLRTIISKWNEEKTVVLKFTDGALKNESDNRLHTLWLLGINISTEEGFPSAPYKWALSVLFLSQHKDLLMAATDRFAQVTDRPEKSTISLFDMAYAIVDLNILADPSYMFVHACECPVIGLVNEPPKQKEQFRADWLLAFNPAILYLLPESLGAKVFPITFPLFHAWEFNFLPQWDERRDLAVFIAPELLKWGGRTIIPPLERFNIPILTTTEGVENFKFVIFPVGLDVHQLYCPPAAIEIIRRGCYIITNNGLALHYPTGVGGLNVINDADLLPALFSAYDEIRHVVDAKKRIADMTMLLSEYTYEGLLYYFVTLAGKSVIPT